MKFRRKSASTEPEQPVEGQADPQAGPDAQDGQPGAPEDGEQRTSTPAGPYDVDDMPDLPEGVQRVDLGSLLIAPTVGNELRLQVDESSGEVQAVLLTGPDGALELRAFSAPRHGDLWSEVRPQIAADMAQRGGVASEQDGRWGPELHCELQRTLSDGRTGTQLSRILGINGPRWMLRATLIGGPARGGETREKWDAVLSTVAVRRGEHAMPVGEALPLVLPENARRMSGNVPRQA